MDSKNNEIEEKRQKLLAMKQYLWLLPVVQINNQSPNPFLTPDLLDFYSNFQVLNNYTGKLFCKDGCEMNIDFHIENAQNSITFFDTSTSLLKNVASATARRSIASYSEIKSSFQNQTKINCLSISLKKFEFSSHFIEPIFITLFLYNTKRKELLSEHCHIVPLNLVSRFQSIEPILPYSDCSFLVDPHHFEEGTYLILTLSHPLTVSNSSDIMKYYGSPTRENEALAYKTITQTFPNAFQAFTIFSFSFIDLHSLTKNQHEILFPEPFIYDGPIIPSQLSDLIIEANNKKLKTISFKIMFIIQPQISKNIVRLTSPVTIQPLFTPINQLIVSIKNLSVKGLFKGRNLIVAISLLKEPNGEKMKCIKSRFNQEPSDTEYTKCTYHERSPIFDDIFVINLPYPLPPSTVLSFSIYNVTAKPSKLINVQKTNKSIQMPKNLSAFTLIASSYIKIIEKEDILLSSEEKTLNLIPAQNVTGLTGTITFSTSLRSNLYSNNKSINDFYKTGNIDNITQPELIVLNLMTILFHIFNPENSQFSIKSLLKIQKYANHKFFKDILIFLLNILHFVILLFQVLHQ